MNVTMPSQRVQDLLRQMEPAHRETLIAILKAKLESEDDPTEMIRIIRGGDEATTEAIYEVLFAFFEEEPTGGWNNEDE